MASMGELYAEGRRRITELVAPLDAGRAALPVGACPVWSVHDVLAHVVGICADILDGNIAGVATDPWTAAQVAARKDRSIADLLTEWDDKGAEVESMVDLFPGRVSRQLVLDLTEHEHDIRGALGKPGARDAPAVATGVDFLVTVVLGPSLIARGLGPLEVRAQGQTLVAGTGQPALTADPAGIAAAFEEISGALLTGTADPPPPQRDPVASVAAPAFELLRALTGRRSASQIAAFDWSAPPDPFIPAFAAGPFTMPDHDIVE